MLGRLKDGVSIDEAQRDLSQIGASIAATFPEDYRTLALQPVPLQDAIVGDIKQPLLVIMGAVAFVLLIACANVANLFLVRATARESEMAVRAALGAGKTRLVRQLITESVLLSAVGGVAGLVLATWGMKALLRLAPENLPRVGTATIDATALVLTLVVALLTGLVFGLLPAMQLGKDVAGALRAGSRGTRTRHASTRRDCRRGSGARRHATRRRGAAAAQLSALTRRRSRLPSRERAHVSALASRAELPE